jgi:RNA polymerase subunit RPABC4/transcription elongation factor Spt4
MAKNVGNIDIQFEDLPEEIDAQPNLLSEAEPEKMKITPNNVNFAALLNELDEMDGTTERKQVEKHQMKNCANENCLYALPIDAKFCLKCGTAQLAKFCVECGFKFLAMEKFCPDCGNKR